MTCTEARRRYVRTYASRRAAGSGTPLEHGTSNGYLLGCRDRDVCPGDREGNTCADARAHYRAQRARAAGIAPRPETVDAQTAAAKLRDLRALGLSLRRLAALTGCGRTTIADLMRDDGTGRGRVTVTTLRKIGMLDLAAVSMVHARTGSLADADSTASRAGVEER
jgi:hypothetical protein